ncbi:MAG: hypothetical protein AAF512_22630 [Pseudomonadota bacterium]
MSETHIVGYKISPAVFNASFGANSDSVFHRVLKKQADLLEGSRRRFSYQPEHEKFIEVEEALKALIAGKVTDDILYECACMIEPVLEEMAERLSDTTEERSLWFNMFFWIDEFEPILETLGLNTLKTQWLNFSFQLPGQGETPDWSKVGWPVAALLKESALTQCVKEFDELDLKTALQQVPDKLIRSGKSDELYTMQLREIMRDNLHCLLSWVASCQADNAYLVIIFDGDT